MYISDIFKKNLKMNTDKNKKRLFLVSLGMKKNLSPSFDTTFWKDNK